jgi:hypothetical protein
MSTAAGPSVFEWIEHREGTADLLDCFLLYDQGRLVCVGNAYYQRP